MPSSARLKSCLIRTVKIYEMSCMFIRANPRFSFFLSHVEQTQARNMILVQQPLVDVLLVKLFDLRSAHLATVRRKVAIGFGTHLKQGLVSSSGEQGGEKLLLRNRQSTFQVFHLHRRSR